MPISSTRRARGSGFVAREPIRDGGSNLAILGAQLVFAFLFALFVVFPSMGRDYKAAVICAGFGGISLGATPTAMANMTTVVQKYG